MSPSFRCPSCQFAFRVDERFLGRTVACPREGCGTKLKLPPMQAKAAQRPIAHSAESSRGAAATGASLSGAGRVRESSVVADSDRVVEKRVGEKRDPANSINGSGGSRANNGAQLTSAARRRSRGRVVA